MVLRMASPSGASRCGACGAPTQPSFRFCSACGRPISGAADAGRIRITLVRNDGELGPVFSVDGAEVVCGRTEGELRLPDDATVSPRHARFTLAAGVLRVEDLASVNGTFLRLRAPRRLSPGDELRLGRQLLRLEPVPPPAPGGGAAARPWGSGDAGRRFRLSQLLEGGGTGDVFLLRDGENAIGRDAGEVTFPSDRYVSARHARVTVAGGEVTLADAGSSNGTFVRIAGAAELAAGDQLLVGAQLLRVG
jgi:pSer/pThr/pTyr-binding forkhead associated (FHA) protein